MRRIGAVALLLHVFLVAPGAGAGEGGASAGAGGASAGAGAGAGASSEERIELEHITATLSPAPLVLVQGEAGAVEVSFALRSEGPEPEKQLHWNNYSEATATILSLEEPGGLSAPRGAGIILRERVFILSQPGETSSSEVRTAKVRVSVRPESPPGRHEIRAKVSYHVCTEAGLCLAPETESFGIPIEVVRRGEARSPPPTRDSPSSFADIPAWSWAAVALALVLIAAVLLIPPKRPGAPPPPGEA